MTETVTIDLGDGSTVTAEVIGELPFQQPGEPGATGGYGDVGFGDGRRAAQLGSAVALTLDQVRSTVQGVGRWAAESIAQGAAGSPDHFEVEFGLKLAVKSGQLLGIIAEAGSEAGLTVTLSWDLAARRERAALAAAPDPAPDPAAPAAGPATGAGPTPAGTGQQE
ncbi:CU044_2847 family protein [Streptomyces sp. H39-S7]|uniref:CU044_2847 family protein n=1 Tax=Streptomyces sp. H39-S7 TaxID=3004357 RepID=UPI0022AFA7C4|nr:CU044_2847 family protein [Streptomyces sp. H39-S7]MCZ4122273.1 CU044_2847 family protein [Streptomyces sp. H39-S7]